MSEGIKSRSQVLVSVFFTQSVGGCSRTPRQSEGSQTITLMMFKRRIITIAQAPERLDNEGNEVDLRYKLFPTSTICFSSELYKSKMPMILVEFLTASVCQTVPKESRYNPLPQFNSKKVQVQKDTEVFRDKSKREGAALGWI